MAAPDYPGLDTLALHAGAQPDPATGARATPKPPQTPPPLNNIHPNHYFTHLMPPRGR